MILVMMNRTENDFDRTNIHSDDRCDNDLPGLAGTDVETHIDQFFFHLNGMEDVPTAYDSDLSDETIRTGNIWNEQTRVPSEGPPAEPAAPGGNQTTFSDDKGSLKRQRAENPPVDKKKSNKRRVIIAVLSIILAVGIGTGSVFFIQNKPGRSSSVSPTNAPSTTESAGETPSAVAAAEESTEIATVEPERTPSLSDVYDYYQQQIDETAKQNASGRNQETAGFNLYDMDGNGIPELFLYGGYKTNSHGSFSVYSYSSENGGRLLGTINSESRSFYDKEPGDGAINVICVHHGTMAEYSYRIVDDTLEESVVTDWHERADDEYDNVVEAVKSTLIMEGEWIPLETAASYLKELCNQ